MKRIIPLVILFTLLIIPSATALELNHVYIEVLENGDVSQSWDYSLSWLEGLLLPYFDIEGEIENVIYKEFTKFPENLEYDTDSLHFTIPDAAEINNGAYSIPQIDIYNIEKNLKNQIVSNGLVDLIVDVNLKTDATIRFHDGYSLTYSDTYTIPSVSHYPNPSLVNSQLEAKSMVAIIDHMIPVYDTKNYSLKMVNTEWIKKFVQPIELSFLKMQTASNLESIKELVDLTNNLISNEDMTSLFDDSGFIGVMSGGRQIHNDEFASELVELKDLLSSEEILISDYMNSGNYGDKAKLKENLYDQSGVLTRMKETYGKMLENKKNPTFIAYSKGVQNTLSSLIDYSGTITDVEERHIQNTRNALNL